MKIALAADHRSFEFKTHVASMLAQMGHTVGIWHDNRR